MRGFQQNLLVCQRVWKTARPFVTRPKVFVIILFRQQKEVISWHKTVCPHCDYMWSVLTRDWTEQEVHQIKQLNSATRKVQIIDRLCTYYNHHYQGCLLWKFILLAVSYGVCITSMQTQSSLYRQMPYSWAVLTASEQAVQMSPMYLLYYPIILAEF